MKIEVKNVREAGIEPPPFWRVTNCNFHHPEKFGFFGGKPNLSGERADLSGQKADFSGKGRTFVGKKLDFSGEKLDSSGKKWGISGQKPDLCRRLCFGLARACVPRASEVWDWLREHNSFSLDACERVGFHRCESRFELAVVALHR